MTAYSIFNVPGRVNQKPQRGLREHPSQGVAGGKASFAPLESKNFEEFFDPPDFLAHVLMRNTLQRSNFSRAIPIENVEGQ